jgi:hypothetical protein
MKPNGSWLVLGNSLCFHTNGEAPLTCRLRLARTDPLRTPALFAEQTIDRPLTSGISSYMLRAGQAARIIVSTWKQTSTTEIMAGSSEICAVHRYKADVSAPGSSFHAPSSNACVPPETANLLAATKGN